MRSLVVELRKYFIYGLINIVTEECQISEQIQSSGRIEKSNVMSTCRNAGAFILYKSKVLRD